MIQRLHVLHARVRASADATAAERALAHAHAEQRKADRLEAFRQRHESDKEGE